MQKVKGLIDRGGEIKQAEILNQIQAAKGELKEKINNSIETIENIVTAKQLAKQQIENLQIDNQGVDEVIDTIDNEKIKKLKMLMMK